MKEKIHLAKNGKEIGVFSKEHIECLVRQKEVELTDKYWHKGMPKWKTIAEGNFFIPEESCENIDAKNLKIEDSKVVAFKKAGFFRRVAAFFVDICIVGVPFFGISFFAKSVVLDYMFFAMFCLYFASFESSKFKASLGKMIFSMQVLDDENRKLSFLKAASRSLLVLMAFILFAVAPMMKLPVVIFPIVYLGFYVAKNCSDFIHDTLTKTSVKKINIIK